MFMHTRTRKILRDLWRYRLRTLLVCLSLWIGITSVTAFTSAANILITTLNHDLDPADTPMLRVWFDSASPSATDTEQILAAARAYPNVTLVEGQRQGIVLWKPSAAGPFLEGNLRAYSVPLGENQLEPLRLIEGRYPAPNRTELAIEQTMAERYDLQRGMTLQVQVLSANIGNAGAPPRVETWTIVGIVFHPFITERDVALYAQATAATYLTGIKGYTRLNIRFTDFETARAEHNALLADLQAYTDDQGIKGDLTNPSQTRLLTRARQWTDTMTLLALLALTISSLLVMTVISTIVLEQRRAIAFIKVVGATNSDLFLMYGGLALSFGLIVLLPSLALGIAISERLVRLAAPLLNIYVKDVGLSWVGITVGMGLGLLIPTAAAAVPIVQGLRFTLLEGMNDFGITSQYGKGILSRGLGRLPLPYALRQGIASAYLKRGRLTMTGLTLTMASAVVTAVTSLLLGFNSAYSQIDRTRHFQLSVTLPEPTETTLPEDYAAIQTSLAAAFPDLEFYRIVGGSIRFLIDENGSITDENNLRTFRVVAINPDDNLIAFDFVEGRTWRFQPATPDIIISENLANALDKDVYETVTVAYEQERLNLRIIGIDRYPLAIAFVNLAALEPLAPEPIVYFQFWVRAKDPTLSTTELDRQAAAIRDFIVREHGVFPTVENERATLDDDRHLILRVGLIFNAATLLFALLGAIGLVTMIFISVYERQREIGIMRSCGASSRAVAFQFLIEAQIIGGVAWLMSIPLAMLIADILKNALPLQEFYLPFRPMALLMSLAGMVILALLSSLVPAIVAARRSVASILHYQ